MGLVNLLFSCNIEREEWFEAHRDGFMMWVRGVWAQVLAPLSIQRKGNWWYAV